MKIFSRTLSLCLALAATPLLAGTGFDTVATNGSATTDNTSFPFEFEAEFSYIGESRVERGFRAIEFDETHFATRFIYTPRIAVGILRLGGAYERFGFGMPDLVQLPDTLQSISAVVGLDTKLGDSILLRFEAQPGLYGTDDDFDGDTFNVPVILGGTYIFSDTLQFVLGVSVNYERRNAFLPGGGIRWRMGSKFTLNAVLPTPRLEYELNQSFMIYAGANLKGSTVRTDDRFGTDRAGDTSLNNAVLSYTEVRAGLGFEWKLTPEMKLSVEGGYVPWREFDFHRTNVRYHHEKGAPYGSAAFRVAF